jgi:hypothetical protein
VAWAIAQYLLRPIVVDGRSVNIYLFIMEAEGIKGGLLSESIRESP